MLGRGSFATVFKVWDPELQTHRAVKMPHTHLIASGRVDAESYVREARKVTQLGKHRGIVEVLDVQRLENGTPYVVSEFVSGGSLADKVEGKRMPWREAAELVAKIADGVAHAHSKGIVHRDLKPANILLTEEGEPLVGDFGLALGDAEFSYKSTTCGTFFYMSPQQVRGEADRVDGRADIYSLGVILYQLLAGRIPYKSQAIDSLKREILSELPTSVRQYNPDVPPELAAICEKAMAKEPNDRFTTATDMAKALRAAVKTAEVPGTKAAKQPPKSWMPVAIAAAGFAAVAAGLLALLSPDRATIEDGSGGANPVVGQTAPVPELSIHFQAAGSEVYHKNLMRADLPIVAGDKVQFHVQMVKPMYPYVYWINSSGEAQRVWPALNASLDGQKPVTELSSPPGADRENDPEWWEIQETGGPQVFFVGVSPKKLGAAELSEFEADTQFMRSLLPRDELFAEFEFPERPDQYQSTERGQVRTRGSDLIVVVSPKSYAADHSDLQQWFTAYHGWIVATEE
jgi:serine/threonine protein kinase